MTQVDLVPDRQHNIEMDSNFSKAWHVFYLWSGPIARHPMTSRSTLRLAVTSQIFSLGSPTTTSVFTSTCKTIPINEHPKQSKQLLTRTRHVIPLYILLGANLERVIQDRLRDTPLVRLDGLREGRHLHLS
jgi:hypothetical protein